MKHSFLSAVAIFVLAGCGTAPYNKNFPLIEVGDSMERVTELIGQPISAESGPESTKVLYYRLASSPLDTDGSDTREYYVVMKEREVIGYGERVDEITMQRAIIQYNAAWESARMMNEQPDVIINNN